MNRLKMKKLAILATLGIIIFTLIPAVQGAKTGINFRPIDDWVYGPNPDVWAESDYLPWGPNNPFGSGGGYGDPDSMLVIWLFEWIANDPWNDFRSKRHAYGCSRLGGSVGIGGIYGFYLSDKIHTRKRDSWRIFNE